MSLPSSLKDFAATAARSPRHASEALLALARAACAEPPGEPDADAVARLDDLAAAWATLDADLRERLAIIVRHWIESPEDTVLVEMRAAQGRELLVLGARLAGLLGDVAEFGPSVVERLRMGPPAPAIVLAAGRLGLAEAVPDLRRIAATEPALRHAALVALAHLDRDATFDELERELRDAGDLLNDAVAQRGHATTHATFHTVVELLVLRHGPAVLPLLAARLRGQQPAKNRLLADYLADVARAPALLPATPDDATARRLAGEIDAALA